MSVSPEKIRALRVYVDSVPDWEPETTKVTSDAPQVMAETPKAEILTIEEAQTRFVHVARGPIVVDLRNNRRRFKPAEFHGHYAASKTVVAQKLIPVTQAWASSPERIAVDLMTFDPLHGRFFSENGQHHLNLWQAPVWPTGKVGDAKPFLEHLTYLVPNKLEREDFLDWVAHAVQFPGIRPHHHFLFVAAQEGTGRSWIGEVFRKLWTERHAGEADLHKLLDDTFNSALSCRVFLVVNEVKAPADERYSHKDRLKSLLTDTQLTVNEKHEPRYTEKFVTRFLMFTNRDDALPLSETDRRLYVARCADHPQSEGYYQNLYARLNDRVFLAGVWQYLKSRDIRAFNPGRRPPLTEMKQQMISAGRTDEQQTAIELVTHCPYAVVAADDLMRALAPEIEGETFRDRKGRMNGISASLKEIGKQTAPRKVFLQGKTTRVWIMRNAAEWSTATGAKLTEAALLARNDFTQSSWSADGLIEHWKPST